MSLAKQVASWFEQNSQPFAGESAIAWVQAHWPELAQISTRQLSGADLILIRQRIKQIPTGKQRLYRQGLNDLLYYLSSVCHWSLPVSQQQYFIDREQIWFCVRCQISIFQHTQPCGFIVQPINSVCLLNTLSRCVGFDPFYCQTFL